MSLAILIPYRAESFHRQRIFNTTSRLWHGMGIAPIYASDDLTGPFSFARAANRARARTGAECLIVYNCDALPLSTDALASLEDRLASGVPWTVIFDGQQRFTEDQTNHLIAGHEPYTVGPAKGQICMGRSALLGIRADVFDEIRGYDERFIGWGPEDDAIHKILTTLYPKGHDKPEHGLFQSLWHPDVPRQLWNANFDLWGTYRSFEDPDALRAWYLDRP